MPKELDHTLLLKKLTASWQKAFLRLFPLGGFSTHNKVKIIHDGDEAFLAIVEAIKKATVSIYIETYILAADRLGFWLAEELIAAKRRGVEVTILYDHLGSAGLSNSFLSAMTKEGIKILAFNPIWPWRRSGPLLFRDHRKIVVVDEATAFCGGMNISADYAGPIYGKDRFRDSIACIKGPAVRDLFLITLESIAETEFAERPAALVETLDFCIDKSLAFKLFLQRLWHSADSFEPLTKAQGTLVQVLRSNMRRNLTHIQKSMEECVNRSVSYCYFTTPYFLPNDGLRKAMINAARRGVDVRILTAGLSDVPLMRYASRHVYRGFLQHGIRIYEMTKKTLHAKLATIDGLHASIGSYNLDHWSARRNLEVNLSIIDQDIALTLKEQFHHDLSLSHEINKDEFFKRSIWRRLLCWLAYALMRL
jgi:cardiolipin synthase A/B